MAAIVAHPAFLMVDHIHFQYNGMLFGILIFSLCAAKRVGVLLPHAKQKPGSSLGVQKEQYPLCAALFAVLLNFKHIFMYISLPYLFFLLRVHCIEDGKALSNVLCPHLMLTNRNLLSRSSAAFSHSATGKRRSWYHVFVFWPLPSRRRGRRVEANLQSPVSLPAWAESCLLGTQRVGTLNDCRPRSHVLYVSCVISSWLSIDLGPTVYIKSGHPVDPLALSASSRGLVGDTHFGVVPQVTPKICFALTIASNLVWSPQDATLNLADVLHRLSWRNYGRNRPIRPL